MFPLCLEALQIHESDAAAVYIKVVLVEKEWKTPELVKFAECAHKLNASRHVMRTEDIQTSC